MHTAKLFANGKSQAMRLPKEFRFEGDEIHGPEVEMLSPKALRGKIAQLHEHEHEQAVRKDQNPGR